MSNNYLIAILALTCLPRIDAQTLTRGAYLQNSGTTAITVRWRTGTAADSVVRYGTAAGALTQFANVSGTRTEHEVRLTGLTPDTKYFYSVGTSSATLAGDASHCFLTAPVSGKPTRVWVLGDAGNGSAGQIQVRDAYYAFTGARHTDLWLMLGDNAYNSGTDSEYTSYLFDVYPAMLRKSAVWATLGNHDAASADSPTQAGPYYAQHTFPKQGESGGVPSGTEAYYSFDYGNIHFVCLDSEDTNLAAGGAMATWVTSDLQNNNKDWTVVFFHHPPYSKGSHDSDTESQLISMRTNFNPILETYGTDLVLCGHSHSYERSKLIDGHYGNSGTFNASTMVKQAGGGQGAGGYTKTAVGPVPHQGTVYAVSGASGAATGGALNHPAMWISLNVLGSMVLDIDGNRLKAVYLDNAGAQRDGFTMVKGGAPNALPAVTITRPPNGTGLLAPATITIEAAASDADGSVVRVDFYRGTTLLGSDISSPYGFTWTNVPSGSYSLTAVATDNEGGAGSSAAVPVSVSSSGNTAPVASVTGPATGAVFTAPATILIGASAADTDGTVARVDFYADATLLGSDADSPYSLTWSNVPAGNYFLTAVATDDRGATGTSTAVAVTVNPAGSATTVSFRNGAGGYAGMVDTHIRSERATTNFGNATTLKADGSPDYAVLLKWDLSTIPPGVTVANVTLTFNVTDVSSNVYELYALRRGWSESSATWMQAGSGLNWATSGAGSTSVDRDNTVLASLAAPSTGLRTVSLNLSGITTVQSWINSPMTNNGFILQDYANSNAVDLSSSESSNPNLRPLLTITYGQGVAGPARVTAAAAQTPGVTTPPRPPAPARRFR